MSEPQKGRIRPNTYMSPNEHVDEAIEMLSAEEYKVLAYTVRHTWGWHVDQRAMSISMYVTGFGRYCSVGLSRSTVIKCLAELSKYKLLIPVGKPNADGQVWSVGLDPDLEGLEKRFLASKSKNKEHIAAARAQRGKAKVAVYGIDQSAQQTDIGLSDRTPAVYAIDANKDSTKDNSKDILLAPAIAERPEAASHTHTSPDVTQSEDWPEGQQEADDNMFIPLMEEQIPAQAEKVMSPAVSPSPSLEATMGEKSKETTTPQPPIAAEPPSPSDKKLESPAQAAQRIKTESLVACGFAQPVTSRGWSNFKGVIKTLTEAKITPEIYADYVKWVKALAKRTGDWDVTLNSIAEKNRPETYMEFRAKNAISGDSSGLHVSTTPSGAKRGYDPRKDPAYAHLYASPDERKQAK